MVEQSRSRGRAEAWRPWIAAGRRPALAWPQGLTDFARRAAQRVREWTAAEVAPGRLVPWLAIAFGCGTIIYFAVECDREPRHQPARSDLSRRPYAHALCRATRKVGEALRPRECGPAPRRDPRPPCLGPPARSTLLDHRAAP